MPQIPEHIRFVRTSAPDFASNHQTRLPFPYPVFDYHTIRPFPDAVSPSQKEAFDVFHFMIDEKPCSIERKIIPVADLVRIQVRNHPVIDGTFELITSVTNASSFFITEKATAEDRTFTAHYDGTLPTLQRLVLSDLHLNGRGTQQADITVDEEAMNVVIWDVYEGYRMENTSYTGGYSGDEWVIRQPFFTLSLSPKRPDSLFLVLASEYGQNMVAKVPLTLPTLTHEALIGNDPKPLKAAFGGVDFACKHYER